MSISPLAQISPTGVVSCREHGANAAIRTSHTASNPGRLFYRCPIQECKLFVWKDQLDAQLHAQDQAAPEPSPVQSSPPRPPSARVSPSTPTHPRVPLYPSLASPTSPETTVSGVPGHWPSSPSKRNRFTPPDDPTADENVIRQKRQKALDSALDVGLSTRGSPILKPANKAETSSFTRNDPSSSSSSSSSSTTSSMNQALQNRPVAPVTPMSARAQRYAQQIREALGTPESPSRAPPPSAMSSGNTPFAGTNTTPRPEDRSATPTPSPTRIRVYRLSELKSANNNDDRMPLDDGSTSSQYYTPPGRAPDAMDEGGEREESRSEEEYWRGVATPPQSALSASIMSNGHGTSTRGKGKGKAREDTEEDMDWFRDGQPEWSQSSFYAPSPSSTQDSSGMSGDRLLSLFGELATVPQYVQRLERKLAAAEKANMSKMKRIRELENEIGRLQALLRNL